jgi:hypothetical protein
MPFFFFFFFFFAASRYIFFIAVLPLCHSHFFFRRHCAQPLPPRDAITPLRRRYFHAAFSFDCFDFSIRHFAAMPLPFSLSHISAISLRHFFIRFSAFFLAVFAIDYVFAISFAFHADAAPLFSLSATLASFAASAAAASAAIDFLRFSPHADSFASLIFAMPAFSQRYAMPLRRADYATPPPLSMSCFASWLSQAMPLLLPWLSPAPRHYFSFRPADAARIAFSRPPGAIAFDIFRQRRFSRRHAAFISFRRRHALALSHSRAERQPITPPPLSPPSFRRIRAIAAAAAIFGRRFSLFACRFAAMPLIRRATPLLMLLRCHTPC